MTTKIVVVTSGKGGVGKTTTSASFATGLAMRGFKTCVIDFDVGLRNLDLIMGVERRVVCDLINVVNEEIKLTQALIKDKQLDAFRRYPSLVRRDFWRFRKGEGLSGDWAFALREVPKGPVQPASIDEAEVP